MTSPVQGLNGKNRFHGLKVMITVQQDKMVLHADGGNQTIRGRRGDAALPQTSGMIPGFVPPRRIERHMRDRREPIQQRSGLLGLGKTGHEFQQNPFSDGSSPPRNQRFESRLDLRRSGRTERMNPDRRINEIHAGFACAVAAATGRLSARAGWCRGRRRRTEDGDAGSPCEGFAQPCLLSNRCPGPFAPLEGDSGRCRLWFSYMAILSSCSHIVEA